MMDILITGPQGAGKTSLAQDAAARAMKSAPKTNSWRTTEMRGTGPYETPTALARWLRDCDVVIFDDLASAEDLTFCRAAVVQVRAYNPAVIAVYCSQLDMFNLFNS